jgi:phenylacetate-CoA ligase
MHRYPEIVNYHVVVTSGEKGDEMTFYIELETERIDRKSLKVRLEDAVQETLKLRGKIEFIPKGSIPEEAKTIEDRRDWR